MKRKSIGMWLSLGPLASMICLAAAGLLLAAALGQPKEKSSKSWIPLNDAVAAALQAWEAEELAAEASHAADMSGEAGTEGDGKTAVIDADASADKAIGEAQSSDNLADIEPEDSAYYMGLIDINRASAEQLTALPGIGPAKAEGIVQDRETNGRFEQIEDLLRVRGIGQKIFDGLKESVVVRP